MLRFVLLAISIVMSLALAFLSAMLLDYSLVEPYVYSVTHFDPSSAFSYIQFVILYAPIPIAAMCFWPRRTRH